MPETIEDIILDYDKRGMLALRPHLPADFCEQAAQYVVDHPGHTLIVTGFYVLMAGKPETDGPPGAIAIGNALQSLGRKVSYVTDACTAPVLRQWAGEAEVIEFPVADVEESKRHAAELLERLRPDLLVSIERCGRNNNDEYLNMRGRSITHETARVDYLFDGSVPSVGIGDGGNEIGMGNLVEIIPSVDSLPDDPAIAEVDRLVIASVSNWGGYGLVAAISRLTGRNLLPSAEAEDLMVQGMVEAGAVDGTTGDAVPTVDNFSMEENGALLARLHRIADGEQS
ncbi:MAG: DUF4392 domain-containing protein [Chloroflexi bacterium]|nr:DUF4392 domain-containing protein [Chloroflexota bacterium]MYE40841.1 DUF4392 domain-containing protein [Chloroflexota bacterium]